MRRLTADRPIDGLPSELGPVMTAARARAPARQRVLHPAPGAFGERLRASVRPETRGICLNTPNNPTGAVLSVAQLEAIAAVAIDRDLWVVSDEAYEHLLFDGRRHVSLASLPGMAERTVS